MLSTDSGGKCKNFKRHDPIWKIYFTVIIMLQSKVNKPHVSIGFEYFNCCINRCSCHIKFNGSVSMSAGIEWRKLKRHHWAFTAVQIIWSLLFGQCVPPQLQVAGDLNNYLRFYFGISWLGQALDSNQWCVIELKSNPCFVVSRKYAINFSPRLTTSRLHMQSKKYTPRNMSHTSFQCSSDMVIDAGKGSKTKCGNRRIWRKVSMRTWR